MSGSLEGAGPVPVGITVTLLATPWWEDAIATVTQFNAVYLMIVGGIVAILMLCIKALELRKAWRHRND